jgi:hypothetical protein
MLVVAVALFTIQEAAALVVLAAVETANLLAVALLKLAL